MIKIHNLQKKYKDFTLSCTMEVAKGRITGLVGQNGAGKTTVFKAMLGLVSTDGGSITLLGKDIKSFDPKDKQRLGVALSDSGFSGYLTIKDIIPILSALYEKFDKEDFLKKLNTFGLPLNKKIKDFSSGMKAKLKVLVALSHGADLLILDEPTAGLDIIARDELLLMLREYMEKNEERAVLISSHISSDLETLCDDIYMIHNGKIILHSDTDTLLSSYAILKADEKQYGSIDKKYITHIKKEGFGYTCLTAERQYYIDNYPSLVIERGTIDGIITMMIKGERI